MAMLELNEVLIAGEQQTLSLMADEGRLTCLTGGTATRRRRWLYAMMGMEPLRVGYITIDGEPITTDTVRELRRLMVFVPEQLCDVGMVQRCEAPSVQEVFSLRANRDLPISNGLLAEEMRRTGIDGEQARRLAVAVLLNRPVLLVDHPAGGSASYLLRQSRMGHTVIVASADETIMAIADKVVEI